MKKTIVILSLIFLLTTILGYNSLAAQSTDWVLPNAKITPGALNVSVTQNNIKSTICVSGWTATIRPKVAYTNNLKKNQLSSTYKYLIPTYGSDMSKYEEDHLISLQLGGSPTDPKNLWPEPWDGNNARVKDVIETKLKKMVCTGIMKLSEAQKAISTNWVAAYNKYK
jgi:hypothetical protein